MGLRGAPSPRRSGGPYPSRLRPKMQAAWEIYNAMGNDAGLDGSQIAGFANE